MTAWVTDDRVFLAWVAHPMEKTPDGKPAKFLPHYAGTLGAAHWFMRGRQQNVMSFLPAIITNKIKNRHLRNLYS
jgi:hypothetical protein